MLTVSESLQTRAKCFFYNVPMYDLPLFHLLTIPFRGQYLFSEQGKGKHILLWARLNTLHTVNTVWVSDIGFAAFLINGTYIHGAALKTSAAVCTRCTILFDFPEADLIDKAPEGP